MKISTPVRGKLACSVAAAALLFAAPVYAQSSAYVDQIGNDNDGSITQTGAGNAVGDSTADRRARQEGDGNTLDIDQGGGDVVGTGGNYQQNNIGLNQTGDANTLTVDQSAVGGSRVFIAQQIGNENEANVAQAGNAAVSNLSQTGDENTMMVTQSGSQFQRNSLGDPGGSQFPNDRGAFQTGNLNSMTVSQGGGGNNDITLASQSQDGNIMNVSQSGGLNRIAAVTQDGLENDATVSQIGSSNGRTSFTGDAAAVGVAGATVAQTGNYNFVSVSSDGDSNLFGISQSGDDNEVMGLQDGNNNEAAVLQLGDGHVVNFNQVGSGNNLGITQN